VTSWTTRQAAEKCGLSQHTLRWYERIGLVRSGAGEQERLDLLEQHRERVRVALAEQRECLALLDTKIGTYRRSVDAAQQGTGN
jgi:DNA-binding transcriptional MerR regulator